MAVCSKCGTELKAGVKFCTECGAKVAVKAAPKKAAPAPTSKPAPAPQPSSNIDPLDEEIADYTRQIALSPNHWRAYHFRGDAYYAQKKYDKAIADYTQTIALTPHNDSDLAGFTREKAYWYRGRCYKAKSDYSKALEDYKAALKLGGIFSSFREYYRKDIAEIKELMKKH
jgi:tetratricopeptide (TPR) repeat protein/DNA-directed RNA polymerase subunit RPC12/RpoP